MYYAYIASEMFVNLNIPCCVCVRVLAQTRKLRETQIMRLLRHTHTNFIY